MIKADCIIIGGGIVGLCVARQLLEKNSTKSIIIIDKENSLGCHSSGKNSGVIHAGIYYIPGSIKAKVCIKGSKRLKRWASQKNIKINQCGKLIVPTKETQDDQIDILKKRGEENGAVVETIDEHDLKKIAPYVNSASGRALWSPNTAVINPLNVIRELQKELIEKGVDIYTGQQNWTIDIQKRCIHLVNSEKIFYGHLFNCGGLHADRIAHAFGIGDKYFLMPFKGIYWQIKKGCQIKPTTNVYPVPDLSVPFLGVHFTPSAGDESLVTIGPTATLAFGSENYEGINGLELKALARNTSILVKKYLLNQDKIRQYVHEQAFLSNPKLLLNAAQKLIPAISRKDIEISKKVAIRPQLFNKETNKLEDDFLCINMDNSTHVLNAISPAFTASFELADLIIKNSNCFEHI